VHELLSKVGGIPLTGQKGAITGVVFSPDGRWLATTSNDDDARLWEVGNPLAVPHILKGHESSPTQDVAFSQDSRWLATRAVDTVRLWDITNPVTATRTFTTVNGIAAVSLSADGRWLAARDRYDVTSLWNISDPNSKPHVSIGTSSGSEVDFSADGRWFAVADKTYFGLWSIAGPGPAVLVLERFEERLSDTHVPGIAFSPDGHWFVTSGQDGSVDLWDITATDYDFVPIPLGGEAPEFGPGYRLAFSPDSRWLVGEFKEAVGLWNVANLNVKSPGDSTPLAPVWSREWSSKWDGSDSVAFSPDSKSLIATLKDQILQWDLEVLADDPNAQPNTFVQEDASAIASSPDGAWTATAHSDGSLRLWDGQQLDADATVQPQILRGGKVKSLVVSSDSRWLATISDDDGSVRLWDVTRPTADSSGLLLDAEDDSIAFSPDNRWLVPIGFFPLRLYDMDDLSAKPRTLPESSAVDVAFSRDGRWLAANEYRGVSIWEIADPAAKPRVYDDLISDYGGISRISTIAFSPDGRWVGASSDTGQVWLLSAVDPAQAPRILQDEENDSGGGSIAFSPDGRWFVATSMSGKFRLWDLNAKPDQAPAVLGSEQNRYGSVTFSPDGRWLAVVSPFTIQLWQVENPAQAPRVLDGVGDVLAFSPDGRWLAIGKGGSSRDQTVSLWDMTDPRTDPRRVLDGTGFAFSSDGRRLATGSTSYGDAYRLWDMTNLNAEPVSLPVDADHIVSPIAFSADGRWLAVKSCAYPYYDCPEDWATGTIALSAWRPGDLIRSACNSAGRNLTAEEQQRYFQNLEHRKTCPQWPVHPSVTQPLLDEARALAKKGDIVGAAAKFKEALRLDPSLVDIEPEVDSKRIYAQIVVSEGYSLASGGDIPGAAAKFQEAMDLDRDVGIEPETQAKRTYANVLFDQGRRLAENGDIVSATVKFDEALALYPDLPIDRETEAKRIWAQEAAAEGRRLAERGDIAGATAMFEEALIRYPEPDIDPETEAKRMWTPSVVREGRDLAAKGDIVGAVEKFEEAVDFDPSIATNSEYAEDWDSLCWVGATLNQAALVLDACEIAVRLAPKDGYIRDSRGLARALTGDVEGAIQDFQFALERVKTEPYNWSFVNSRTKWVEALRAGTDRLAIFDAATLKGLRE
jgi:WD40 repeat protein/tetratricopeptide (TPR) repeat protein